MTVTKPVPGNLPFGYNCIWHNTCEYVKREEFVCVCKTYAFKPQQWGKTTINDSNVVISGKSARGVLCGVKPKLWELKLYTAQVLSLLKDEREEAGTIQSRARGEDKEVKTKEVKTVWKCWLKACGWDSPGFGNSQRQFLVHIPGRYTGSFTPMLRLGKCRENIMQPQN